VGKSRWNQAQHQECTADARNEDNRKGLGFSPGGNCVPSDPLESSLVGNLVMLMTLGIDRVDDGWLYPEWRTSMARKSKLTRVAVGIGTAMGKADRGVQKVAKAGSLAKRELDDISKQVDALKRQLQKTAKRLKRALS
jgi:hypothetical protein